jgi:predicted permease
MHTLFTDLRYAARNLWQRPGFTVVALITLALGIGANTAIFSVVNGVLLQPLPFPDSDRLVSLREVNLVKQPDAQIAPGNFLEWQRQNTVFAQLETYRTVSYNLSGDGNPERLLGARVSYGMFKLLGVQPVVGRYFLPEEDQPGREKVVLISNGLWQRRFGANPSVVGKTLRLSGENFTVIGVLPREFRLPDQRERELWTPIAFKDTEQSLRQARYVDAIARLKPGVTIAQAQTEMNAIAGRLANQYPDTNTGWDVKLKPVLESVVGDIKSTLWLLFGAVGFVLLITCANLTNVLLARAFVRQKEIAIRAALGASRWRILRQLTTESLLLALLGGIAGWPLAVWGLHAVLALAPPDLPRITTVAIDLRALLFALGITLLTGLIFGLVPAVQLSKPAPQDTLKDAGCQGNSGAYHNHIGNLLIVSEVALALVLLIGGGLLSRSLWQLQRVDPGFDYRNALAVTIQLPEKKYAEADRINLFSQELLQQISSLPGVQATSVARILPFIHDLPTGIYFEGRPHAADNQLPQTNYSAVSPNYFKAMGIPLLAGRTFTDRDTQDNPRVALISETLAKRFFPNENPLGKRLNVETGPEAFREIVGVVGDVKQNGLARETRPHTYEPFAQAPNQFLTLIVRTTSDPQAFVPAIRSKVSEIDNELPVQSVRTLESMIANSLRQQRFIALVLSIFACVALFLAAAGLYGVISYSVTQRTRELGIRVALGAQISSVMRLVLRQAMTFVLIGEAVGLIASFALSRLLSGFLFGIKPTDALTFAAVTLVLTGVALMACYVPARRATKVDPLVAIRGE